MAAPLISTQRSSIRLPCHIPAEIKFSGGTMEVKKKAIISNISTTGIQILSPSFVATGQKLTASFKVPGKPRATYTAEIMRIESLQSRMVGHFPYALGAKFVDFHPKQEKKIVDYIHGEITCRPWRYAVTAAMLILAFAEISRIMIHTYLAQSAETLSFWEHAAPFYSAILAAGYLATGTSALMNQKFFTRMGLPFLVGGAVVAAARITLKFPLVTHYEETGMMILGYEVLLGALSLSFIFALMKIAAFYKHMELTLTAETVSPSGRPTFTII